jgi:membrane-associated phospholipid phosphatase
MTIETLAEFAGSHGMLIFTVATVVMLILTVLSWRLIERHGGSLQQWVVHGVKRVLQAMDSRWLNGRLASIEPGEYLVMHVVVGFTVIFIALAVFFELTEALAIDDDLGRFDHALAQTLRITVSDNTYQFFSLITHLGDALVLTVVSALVALGLAWRRHGLQLAGWLTAVIGNGILTRALKALFQRLRPLHDHGFATADGWSFPSGHSSGALVVYGMLAYLLIRGADRRWHLSIVLLTIALILVVGSSRVFLQVHFFSDVIAGFCSGAAWLAVCVAGTEIVLHQRRSLR